MSSSSPPPPDFDRVEKGVNLFTTLPSKLSTFVRDIAGWIRKRQWLELLMLVVAIAYAIGKLNQPEKAADLLEQALTSVNQIQDSYDKDYALSAIAEAEANLKNWGKVLEATQQCPSQDCKVDSLARALTVYAEQQHPKLKKS